MQPASAPAKVPVKVPVKMPMKVPVPAPAPPRRHRDEDSDDEQLFRKRSKVDTTSSSSSSGSDSGSSSSASQSRSSSQSSVQLSEDDEPTLFDLAKDDGLIKAEAEALLDEPAADAAPAIPPRPPIIRSFPSDISKSLQQFKDRLNREENAIRMKDDNKAVALGTSKVNYIDPRIICSWAKEHDVPITRIFSATLIKKFPWAMSSENFDF